ncbi:MAG: phosphoesterase, partial [Terracidiphilus sp.]
MRFTAPATTHLLLSVLSASLLGAQTAPETSNLPTSKQLIGEAPGHPQRLNSLPVSLALSPDGRYLAAANAGYGTFESGYKQSIAVMDTRTDHVRDFPVEGTLAGNSGQSLNSGLAFSADGSRLYATLASTTDPEGKGREATGNAILVYRFNSGALEKERLIRLPLRQLDAGRKTRLIGEADGDKAIPYPAALAVVGAPGAEKLLVAENLADDVLLVDAASGAVERRFDLTESDAVPATYPIAIAVEPGGRRAFVALWNASEIVELD